MPVPASQTVFITGASRGIGAATARAFARTGVRRFILHYNSFKPGAEAVADSLRAQGAECHLIQA
ncbi:MAG: SDR family NAD(P)-dependent oxidoreductase, partial [Acidobacteriota bacterium]|nr:SDR family NAD(P)-dependent oxidoreductase [Acidobacteriota bacterium]